MATLIAPTNYSAGADAEALKKAFQGWGTDEKTVIAILGHRNVYQRLQIRKSYHEIHQEDLIKRLESELSGDFERQSELGCYNLSEQQIAIEEAFLANQGFIEKLIADINIAAGNTGYSDSILKGFQELTASNQNAARQFPNQDLFGRRQTRDHVKYVDSNFLS